VTPTVEEVADVAEVSRRTAYRYFPTQEQMLVESALEALRPEVEGLIEREGLSADPEARLDAVVEIIQRLAFTHEPLLRTMIRLTVGRAKDEQSNGGSDGTPLRGRRRTDWIETALEPVHHQLSKKRYERLVSALSLCIGTEALIVLRDIRGLDKEASIKVSKWVAKALLRESLAEQNK
jgi:AcrR family transcriptional regulator